jgi:RNA polymerase sporulation-specific sigma factor
VSTVVSLSEVSERLTQSRARYADCADHEVIARAQGGEDAASEYLLYRFRNLVRTKVNSYYLVGAEKEDLFQVGMIGLWQAIVDFRPDRAISFPAFAKICITRHIITAIKTATRQKQMPLNRSLSLESPSEEATFPWAPRDIIPIGARFDPEELVLKREDTKLLHETIQRMLSDFEWRVLSGYKSGKSYREIAGDLSCKTKSIDNALVRIKRKVSSVPIGNADLARLM